MRGGIIHSSKTARGIKIVDECISIYIYISVWCQTAIGLGWFLATLFHAVAS